MLAAISFYIVRFAAFPRLARLLLKDGVVKTERK